MFGTQTTGTVNVDVGTFGGSGAVSGNVVINNGGHIAPGASAGVLNVGALTLNPGSILDFELDTPAASDQINVTGELALNGGAFDITNLGGLNAGTYTLIQYGSRTGSVLNFGPITAPTGFDYELVDTGSMINLIVDLPGVPGDFNDDGIVDSGDYLIWKKYANTEADLPNDGNLPGPIGPAHYALWQQNFGAVAGGGSGSPVPEPTTVAVVALGLAAFSSRRRRRA
jgi:hypothetical protein